MAEKIATREAYGNALAEFGEKYDIVVLDADLAAAVEAAKACKGKPTVIIAKSTKGKGVSFMENQASWHGAAPNKEQYEQAVAELNAALAAL